MKKTAKYTLSLFTIWIVWAMFFTSQASVHDSKSYRSSNTALGDTGNRYPLKPVPEYPIGETEETRGIQLKAPSNIKKEVELDPETGEYVIREKIGNMNYRSPRQMTLQEYQQYSLDRSKRDYWRQKAISGDADRQFAPKFNLGGEAFDKIFGTNVINIQPQGSAELIFGYNVSKIDNPVLPVRLRKTPSFNFEERIQMNVQGTIGTRVKIGLQYNTEATFEFENKTKLEYAGEEDEIIKKIEVGNVTMPLSGSLITGSHSLFGIKTELQFGKLFVTSVLSQQKGQSSTINVQGGAQTSKFEVFADQYEANKHFFLSHFFKEQYDESMKYLPLVMSGIQITRIEVWVTNKAGQFQESRNIAAFLDLAENDPENITNSANITVNNAIKFPCNEANRLYAGIINKVNDFNNINPLMYSGLQLGKDFEKIENARKLSERDYTLNAQLGYISINTSLNADEVLAVAYEYTYMGRTYKVGQFSAEGANTNTETQNALIVKLLKGTSFSPRYKNWDLMMKNIYSLNAYQVSSEEFMLFVLYQNDRKGTDINYIPESKHGIEKDILLRVMNLDSLNNLGEPNPDGMFDFVEGLTINSANGRVIFPVREPFGKGLYDYFYKKALRETNNVSEAERSAEELIKKYGYPELYDSTLTKARLVSEKNKFKLTGSYKSSSGSDISLNAMNIPQGSVKVTANGVPLLENQDYTVDYTLGRVKIINQGVLNSGNPIKVSLENQSLFNMQTKSLVGTNLVYKFNDDFNVGGTIMHLNERPLTQKVNLYSEPISNTIWGLNGAYRTQSNYITTLVDKLPFFSTKAPSEVTLMGEFAQLIPGSSKAIGKNGVAYIDDFEGSETTIELKSVPSWRLASIPNSIRENPNAQALPYDANFNRALLSWYVIDPLFNRDNSYTPDHIKGDDKVKGDHFVREVPIREIFPNLNTPNNLATTIPVFNLSFYPKERGPYNFNIALNADGTIATAPEQNWGGIMRELQTTDFEASNVQYIEFWLMDPYWQYRNDAIAAYKKTGSPSPGKLYFNLGDVSEDVLPDGRKSFENGLPTGSITDPDKLQIDETKWAVVPTAQSNVKAFDNNVSSRIYQDVGLDGMDDAKEGTFHADFLEDIRKIPLSTEAYEKISSDPAADNYSYFRGDELDEREATILDRYKYYNNGLEGNSPANDNNAMPTAASTMPDDEDINRDNTLNQIESFFEYEIDLDYDKFDVGKNPYITSWIDGEAGEGEYKSKVRWFQFKVPINDYVDAVNGKEDFKSMRFMRMYLKGFSDTTILRFAKLELVRGEWRKYELSLYQGGEYEMIQNTRGSFDVTAVNIEKNSDRKPVNYVLPPGIDRVIDPTNPQVRMLNEQAMVLKVFDLADGDAKAAFKTVNLDLRQYQKMKMFVHAEQVQVQGSTLELKDEELALFIRVGSDYKDNYYEYEIPLKLTDFGGGKNFKKFTDSDTDRELVWPEDNTFDLDLEEFQNVKLDRNKNQPNDANKIYAVYRGKRKISIRGNPSLSNVRTIMIGIRNPSLKDQRNLPNDALPKSVEVWVNELRLSDFNNKGGWGANARSQIRLADLGMISLSGSTMKPGFGSIEKKVNDREKVETNQVDVSTNVDMGKFFKEETAVQLPIFASYSKTVINPEYNPLQPDIPLDVALREAQSRTERDSIKRRAQDFTERVSLNLSNAKMGKQKQSPKFYDVSNFSTSLSYNHIYSFNPTTSSNQFYNYKGGLNYMFNQRAEPVQPLKNVKFLNNKALSIIRDFNFYYKPQAIMFRTDLNRNYRRVQLRNLNYIPGDKSPTNIETLDPTFMKDFFWNRMYDLKFDLSRSLKLTFNANNMSRIDEFYNYQVTDINSPYYNAPFDDPNYQTMNRDTIWKSVSRGGRNIGYKHNFDLTYTIPINKLPGLDWLSASARYGSSYSWDRQPILRDPSLNYGNTIANNNNTSLTGQANLVTLYNKVPYFKKLNQPVKKTKEEFKTITFEGEITRIKGGSKKTIRHNLGTEDIQKVTAKTKDGAEVKGEFEVVDKHRITFKTEEEHPALAIKIEGKVPLKPSIAKLIMDNTLKAMMGVKNVGLTYSIREGTTLPGFQPESHILGMDPNNQWAPGFPFIFGMQDNSFYKRAQDNDVEKYFMAKNWLPNDTNTKVNVPMMTMHSDQLSLRSSIEPFKGLKIDLTAMRNYSETMSKMYLYGDSTNKLTGNYSMSFLGIGTFFEKLDPKKNYESATFNNFRELTKVKSQELADQRSQEDPNYNSFRANDTSVVSGYHSGYGPTSQQVLIPAFFSAYSGLEMNNKFLNKQIPINALFMIMPNWRITFDGLNKVEWVKKYFKTITLTHAYQSTYNIGTFVSDYLYNPGMETAENILKENNTALDLNGNFRSKYEIGSVSINESFNPLLNIDATLVSNITSRIGFRNMRSLMMSFYNNQLTETRSKEWSVGLGYRFSDMILNVNGKERKGDLKVQADVSVRDDKTIFRKLIEETISPNSGKNVVTIKLSADYMLGNGFTLRIFYDRIQTNPFVSNSFKTTNSNLGFSVRFTLQQQQ